MWERLTYANVMSTIAVFLAMGLGGAWAATHLKKNSVSSKQVKNGSILSKDLKDDKGVTGVDVEDGSIASADLADGSVGTAKIADGSVGTADLAATEATHVVGTSGEPPLGNGGEGDCRYSTVDTSPGTAKVNPASFFKDPAGIVHLWGTLLKADGTGGDAACTDGGTGSAEGVEDSTIFVLPPTYRPDNSELVLSTPSGTVTIAANEDATNSLGTVIPAGSVFADGPTGLVLLDGITFRAASGSAAMRSSKRVPTGSPSRDAELPGVLGG